MAISRVGAANAEAASIALPAHQVGDLIALFIYRIGSTVAPTAPSGWDVLTGPTGANSMNRQVAFKWAQSTSETSGTWTNATMIDAVVYRSNLGLVVPGNVSSVINAASLALTFPALGLRDAGGTAWVVGSACTSSTDNDIETPPTGFTAIQNRVGASGETALYDTNAGVSSFSSITRTMSGTAGNLARMHFELLELPYSVSGSGGRSLINSQQLVRQGWIG